MKKEQAREILLGLWSNDVPFTPDACAEALATAGAFTDGASGPCEICLRPQGEGCGTVGGVPSKDCPLCHGTGRVIEPSRPVANGASEDARTYKQKRRDAIKHVRESGGLTEERAAEIVERSRAATRPVTNGASECPRCGGEGYEPGTEGKTVRRGCTKCRGSGEDNSLGGALSNGAADIGAAGAKTYVPAAVGSKARAEEIREAKFPRGVHTESFRHGAIAMIEALDRAQFFADEATIAEIDRLARAILEDGVDSPLALKFARAVRKFIPARGSR